MARWGAVFVLSALLSFTFLHDSGRSAEELALDRIRPLAPTASSRNIAFALSIDPPFNEVPAESHHQAALLELRSVAANPLTPAHARGLALLCTGEPDRAVGSLRRAAIIENTSDAWSDLSAAYLSAAKQRESGETAVAALAAASAALKIDPQHPTARYNRMVALSWLGLLPEAAHEAHVLTVGRPQLARDKTLRAIEAAGASPHFLERWSAARASLETYAATPQMIAQWIELSPQRVRQWAEGIGLAAWADAVIAGDEVRATQILGELRQIGEGLQRTSGEALLSDVCRQLANDHAVRRVLAQAIGTYRDGRIAHSRGENAHAEASFRQAAAVFERTGSPLRFVARYYVGSSLFVQFRLAETEAVLDPLSKELTGFPSFKAVAAQIAWERGLSHLGLGAISEALEIFASSARRFSELGETGNAAIMNLFSASALENVQRPEEAWSVRRLALVQLAAEGDQKSRLTAITSAADHRTRRDEWAQAEVLFDLAAQIAARVGVKDTYAYLLTRRSVVRAHLGRHRDAAADLARTDALISTFQDVAARRRAEADLHAARAATEKRPDRAIRELDAAIAFYEDSAVATLPSLLLERARRKLAMDQRVEARVDLTRGLETYETRRSGVRDFTQRASLASTAAEILEELMADAVQRDDTADLLRFSERDRGRVLTEAQEGSGIAIETPAVAEWMRSLSASSAIVSFVPVRGRVWAIVVRRDGMQRVDLGSAEAIRQLATRFKAAMSRRAASEVLELSGETYERLVAPLRSDLQGVARIAWIPSQEMRGISFPALLDRTRGRFVVEDFVSVEAPGVSFALAASRLSDRTAAGSALVVSGEAFDRDRFPTLDPLAASRDEARSVAHLYARATLLEGGDATPDKVASELGRYAIVHIAAHGLRGHTPEDGALVLARDGDRSLLTAREIAASRLAHTDLVVLTVCDSADPRALADGAEGLAYSFLQAGVPAVVAASLPIEDVVAGKIALRFHQTFRKSGDPAMALHEVMRGMARDGSGGIVSPTEWAWLTVIGGESGLIARSRVTGKDV